MKIYASKEKFDNALVGRINLYGTAYYRVITWGGNMLYAQTKKDLFAFYPSGGMCSFTLADIKSMTDKIAGYDTDYGKHLRDTPLHQIVPKRKEKYYLFKDAKEFSRYLIINGLEVPDDMQ